jgi:ABC-2 type transport system permease protein
MSAFALALRQVRFENKSFWRNPAVAFFTFVVPLMFLVILNALLGDDTTSINGEEVDMANFYVPAMAALSIVNACYTNLVMTIAIARDEGVLKRVRGTPLPGWAYLFGRVVHSTLIALLLVAIVIVFGAIFYGVDVPTDTMPAFVLTISVAAATFCALGLAVSSFVPNAQAASAIANATVLPILFISDIFVPLGEDPPQWIDTLGNIFPVKHLAEASIAAFNPVGDGSGLELGDLAVIVVWGVGATIVALRYFTWEPRR